MNLVTRVFFLIYGICHCITGYNFQPSPGPEYQNPQADVQAPAYVPSYAKNFGNNYGRSGYSRNGYGTKTGYTGTKTGYTGTKTGYTGTKTGYTGTKTGYTGTKTGYTGTKTGYPGTKNGYGYTSGYSESRTWYSNSGNAPTYQDIQHSANMPYTAVKCEPECMNSGICLAPNQCKCPPNFSGRLCEFEKKPCLTYPPLPVNSMRRCSDEMCSITCLEGHRFPDGSTVANMRCSEGQWQPTRTDLTSVPDCQPECSPPCLNGGVCLSVNTCQCPTEYRGPQCQYSTSVCDFRKLAFNGNYKCKGNAEEFSCLLSCPVGASPSTPLADKYTCLYSTGMFLPQPIPHCVFDEVIIVTPSNHYPGLSNSYYETDFHNKSQSESQTGVKNHLPDNTFEYGKHGVKNNVDIVVQDFTPKGGTCLTWAGVHYKTFDGKIYSFESPCQHILVRDAKEHEYTIAVKQGTCERKDYCPLELTVYLEDKPYILATGEEEGTVVFRSSRRLIPIPASLPGIRVSMPNGYVLVNLDTVGIVIKWDTNNVVVIEGSVLLWNNTQGLCGLLDGNPENDFLTKEGTLAKTRAVLAASWQLNKIGDVCDSTPSAPSACASKSDEDMRKALQFCTKVFSKEKFRKCSKVMDVTQLLETCQWDYCACTMSMSPEECACTTVAVYAKECQRLGVQQMNNWRDADTCPMHCPESKLYKSCGPDIQPSCQFPEPSSVDNATCVEGCFCPQGLLLEAGRCIPKEECPCRQRNKSFKPGSVVPKECNTCTCQAGEWTCTAVPCGARCGAVGDPHYTTFDGLRYDFMGHCTYTLLQAENVTVEVENVACSGAISEEMNLTPSKGTGKPSCTKAVNLKYSGVELHLKQGGFVLVNGKEVASLPVHVGGVLIRAASSLFLIVQLPNGLDLWWDGNTRVFVDVPAGFHDKTLGLCGTFNLNQKDDFLTPEGDIEQSALAFANKWKTRELCQDVDTVEPEHPCKANIENKEAAEKYCSKLMSKLFEPCHWFVSVTSYYESCVYDMCACAGDASRCLCPILGDYAMACAKQGVKIQWRYNVKECELSCSGGQEYTVCADSCQRTCSDVALATRAQCRPHCVEGCACPPGQVLDSSNVCVPLGLCPCYHKGLPFDAGYKEVRAGRRERELCTCVGAHWECVPASPQDIQNYPPAEDLRSNCSSLHHKEFTTCEVAEPLTCKNMHLPPSTTTKECRPGCQCKKGYVLDAGSDKCVLAAECPCHHGGRSFPDGHEMQEECNTCKCVSGNWSCTEKQCAGVCSAWGDSHVTTFDGREYEFEGVCTYLLAKGCADAHDGFEVQIQNAPCGTTGATCSKSITLKVGNAPNEEIVSLTKDAPLPDLSKLERIKRRVVGAYVFLDVPSLGMSLQWDRGMRVYVKVDAMWRNRVKGLCGNYNSDSRDDFQKPEGGIAESSVLIFADSWKLKPTCPKTEAVKDHCRQRPERKDWATTSCGALKRYPFTLCHSEVPPTPYIEQCERDACACDAGDDCACVCTALAAYAHRCVARGVVFKWRTKEQCPMQCDETCESYEPCMSPCPQETCENTYYYKEIQPVCERDTCVEGCKKPADKETTCPEGHIVKNSTSSECVPRAQCKPVCMSLKDGRVVLEGEVIEQDACHTCTCVKKQRSCIGQPCSTEMERPTPTPASRDTTPHDQPLTCLTGWTSWINRGAPQTVDGHSVDREPLPKPNELSIGRPMCEKDKVKEIDCRTVDGHKSPKETGLNVECSLERGLVCDEVGKECPDFEIQVFCQCEDEEEEERSELVSTPSPPFQCLDSSHPNHPHPEDCSKFYECTPDLMNPKQPHAVVKDCPPGLLYSKKLMICDWPASVMSERPECKKDTKESREMLTTVPVSVETSGTVTVPATTQTPTTPSLCPPGQVYKKCAYPCDNLCDHFKKTLELKDQCTIGKKCVEGCVDEAVAGIKCEFASRWRDEKTCVPLKDCTCYSEGKVVKPGGVVSDGCIKCQCLDNELHCDKSECVSQGIPSVSPSSLPMIMTVRTVLTTTPRIVTTTTPIPSTTVSSTTVSSTTLPSTTVPPTTVPPTTSAPFTTLIIKSVVTPPPECNPDRYKNLLWEGAPLPASSFTASSVANEHFEPSFSKLNGEPKEVSAGSWSPAVQDTNQYIQVELPRPTPVYGVLMQGNPLFDQYVTSYEVMYGDDGHAFSPVEGADGKPQVFRGPIDHTGVAKQMFTPFEAKFVRIRPLTWHDAIAIRFELIGCDEVATTTTPTPPTVDFDALLPLPGVDASGNLFGHELIPELVPEPVQCTEPLGLAADLPLESIEVSSNNQDRKYFALTAERGWRPLYSTPGEWIMFDFTSPRNITGVKTKGGVHGWVTTYNIMYTSDLTTFNPVVDDSGTTKTFPANFDKDSVVVNEFRPPIHARYLKVLPLKWKDAIEMRVEPIGCFEPYPTTTVAPTQSPSQPTTEACVLCPGIPATSCDCHNATAKYFDGDSCVSRDQCPCVEGFMTYAVGSAFRGLNCDECVCKLGGVTDCKPVKECACDQDLVPKLTSACECLCTPCPARTKICPTSKLCLPLGKWCDGLQDCPDDERACSTTPPTVTTTVEPTVISTAAPTVAATLPTTTEKPPECPVVKCPPGYLVRLVAPRYSSLTSDLPPPRPRLSYNRYYRGGAKGYSRGGYSKGGYSKGGYSKGGFAKGGYGQTPQLTPVFSLEKAAQSSKAPAQECQQFKCVPKLPPLRPGATAPPQVCSAPVCPPGYSLKLEAVPVGANQCPQYGCTPPPERPVYCNVTGRTFTTFDGHEYKYDVCFHILARDVSPSEAWTVLVRKKCRVSGCQNELLVRQDDQLILVKPSLMIEYDNYEYTVDQTNEICFQKNSFDISQMGNGLAIKSRKYNFTVIYNKDGDVKIGLYKTHKGYVDGLCGFFDGSPSNDLRLPNGGPARSVDEFGRSWAKPGLSPRACRTSVIPPERQRRAWDLCDVITKEPLSKCGKVLNLDMWRSICLEKLCKCTDLLVNGTRRTDEECRCLLVEQLVAECLAADKDLDVAAWRMDLICPAECPPPLVHYDCYSKACEPTCARGAARQACPAQPGQCFPGCYCPAGTLRRGDACLPPQECLDCECHGLGTPAKYTTFEGDDMPFLGNCTYLASRDRNETGVHKYEVYASNGPCEEKTSVVCTKAVHVVYGKNVIHIRKDPVTKKLVTTIGEEVVYKYPVKTNWVTINSPNKQDVTVELLDAFVELSVQQSKMEFAVRVPSHVYANATEGLCGVCAGYQEQLVTSNGTVTDDFELYGKSWEAAPASLAALALPPQEQCDQPTPEPECVPLPPEENQCLNLYDKDKFGPCHALVDPEPFVDSCEADVCANATDICATLEQYASACRRQGVCLDWRTKLCPLACESPLVYRTCVDCERTCDNNDELAKDPKKCGKQPTEGCFCPEGKVRVNNTCIEPTKCFPCDANKEHYAGDEWQEDACSKCTCSKQPGQNVAHVSCTTTACSAPVCSPEEDLLSTPRVGACCNDYLCVPKPKVSVCKEPKKMECGFGQVLKQKTTPDGCTEFACECKPASECEHIPTSSEVELMPGMARVVDTSGCCPRVQMLCRPDTCPEPGTCPPLHEAKVTNVSGACCPQHECVLPADKCLVTLEWEAAAKGGEKARDTPQTFLKDVDAVWLDGPCRSCRCEGAPPAPPAARCSVTECPPITTSDQFVVEPRPVPFACCPVEVQVACRAGDTVYRVGENWTSPHDVCESYQCIEVESGKLERVTTVQTCPDDCEPGWKYFPAEQGSKQCCGKCKPVACICSGVEHAIGTTWLSPDHCTNYTCVNVDGTLQVQTSNETCPEVPTALRKQFVLKEEKPEGKCCNTSEPVACRVGNDIYQEGQSWPSSDPCTNYSCARDGTGRLAHAPRVQSCVTECKRGWLLEPPPQGVCCGHCRQAQCVVDNEYIDTGSTWQSADNCTTYTCERDGDSVLTTSSRVSCPDVSACAPEDLVNETCCQVCVQKPTENLSTCVPTAIPAADTVGLVRAALRGHGACVNAEPVDGFKECRGACDSGTVYNNQTGSHDSKCECCQATQYAPLTATLRCADGSVQPHVVASPSRCACRACGPTLAKHPAKTGYSGVKTPTKREEYDYDIPEIYARMGSEQARR